MPPARARWDARFAAATALAPPWAVRPRWTAAVDAASFPPRSASRRHPLRPLLRATPRCEPSCSGAAWRRLANARGARAHKPRGFAQPFAERRRCSTRRQPAPAGHAAGGAARAGRVLFTAPGRATDWPLPPLSPPLVSGLKAVRWVASVRLGRRRAERRERGVAAGRRARRVAFAVVVPNRRLSLLGARFRAALAGCGAAVALLSAPTLCGSPRRAASCGVLLPLQGLGEEESPLSSCS